MYIVVVLQVQESPNAVSSANAEEVDPVDKYFYHKLVQYEEATNREHIVVTWTCLDRLEEMDTDGTWHHLTYDESRTFIETLLVGLA